MPMQVVSTGLKVSQNAAPLTLPQSTTGTIFTVTGAIWVQAIIGVVTTVIQSQATTFKISSKVGTLTTVDICATVDLNAAAVGTLVMPVTTFATAASTNANGVLIAVPITAPPMAWIHSATGTIIGTTVASSTGAIQWSILWAPLSPGATVV